MSKAAPETLRDYEGRPLSAEELRRIPLFQRLMRSRFGAILFGLIMFLSTFPALVLIGPPFLVLLGTGLASPKSFQKAADFICGRWFFVMITLFELMLGIRIRTFGFNGLLKRRCIFIMNHISHFDWLFFWSVVERQGDLHVWKAVTKNMMKSLPFIGYCMQYGSHVFITRRWEHDLPEFREKIYYYNGLDSYPLQLLLFPEGGDLTPRSLVKSDAYADKNGLPRYKYCLHPRTTGLTYVINAMRDGGLDAIYDVTVGYPDLISKTELEFARGYMPREVHYHVREYKDGDLPQTDEGIAHWCQGLWKEKEERLRDFYTHKEFRDWSTAPQEGSNGRSYRKIPEVCRPKAYLQLAISLVYFAVVTSTLFYMLFNYWMFTVYVITVMLWMGYQTYYKGMDYWIMSFARTSTDQAIAKGRRGQEFAAKISGTGLQ